MGIKLKIITPESVFVNDKEVDQINLQTIDGDMTILENHSPVVSVLKIGELKFKIKDKTTSIHLHRGLLEVSSKQVKILTERLYLIDESGKKINTPESLK